MILSLGFDLSGHTYVENLTLNINLMFFTFSGMCLWPTTLWKKGWFWSSIKWPDPHLSQIKPAFSNFRATASQTERNLRHPTFSWQITVDFFVAVLTSSYFFRLENFKIEITVILVKKRADAIIVIWHHGSGGFRWRLTLREVVMIGSSVNQIRAWE